MPVYRRAARHLPPRSQRRGGPPHPWSDRSNVFRLRGLRRSLPDGPAAGLDIGWGGGRYWGLLAGRLREGSRLVASDVSAGMWEELKPDDNARPLELVPRGSTAEELPMRTSRLDLVT